MTNQSSSTTLERLPAPLGTSETMLPDTETHTELSPDTIRRQIETLASLYWDRSLSATFDNDGMTEYQAFLTRTYGQDHAEEVIEISDHYSHRYKNGCNRSIRIEVIEDTRRFYTSISGDNMIAYVEHEGHWLQITDRDDLDAWTFALSDRFAVALGRYEQRLPEERSAADEDAFMKLCLLKPTLASMAS